MKRDKSKFFVKDYCVNPEKIMCECMKSCSGSNRPRDLIVCECMERCSGSNTFRDVGNHVSKTENSLNKIKPNNDQHSIRKTINDHLADVDSFLTGSTGKVY